MTFLCVDRGQSPSIGVPVYVKDDVLKKMKFPREHRGGVIIEDLSFRDNRNGVLHYAFRVRHKHGEFVWEANELVEIGPDVSVTLGGVEAGSEDDH
jgi:hypothetical protein